MLSSIFKRRYLFALIISLGALSNAWADEKLDARIEQLDEAYQTLAGDIYGASVIPSERIEDPDTLWAQFTYQISQQLFVHAHQLIYNNMQTLTENPDHPVVVQITDSLLKQNERQIAESIYGLTQSSADQTTQAYMNFTFAKYHARHQQWQQVKQLIEDTFSELSGDDDDYAYLLQGSARQHLKQHRKSVESYDNIPATSAYYVHAQLNTALANIRQGWITEARNIIEKLIPVSLSRSNSELTNRIYLVLGYALLQKEYYRDARKAFRSIGIDSAYTNRALMGISLTAISQEDYVGGLNAANILKQNKGQDLSADEAFLVVPYIYEKLEQPLSIEGSFSESIDHYQTRLLQLNALKKRSLDFDNIQLETQSGDLVLDQIRFKFSQHVPRYLLTNRHNLGYLATAISTPGLISRINALTRQYDLLLSEVIGNLIEQRIQFINSYMNQSRYGLAKHYDKQPEAVQ